VTAAFNPANRMLCSVGLALAIFMQVLDTTIANVSLPTIAGNLGATPQQSTWVITAFAVSNAIALPLTGWFTRRFGEVRLFVAATLLFTLTSFLCGIAQNMGMLVFFRAVQGFVAGPMYPVTQALLLSIFPSHKRTQAMTVMTTVAVVAPIAGPIIGGWITDNYSWPWIFFINIPFGIFAAYIVWTQMGHKQQVLQQTTMDYVGLAALVLGVGALQIVLDKGNDEDWFSSNMIIILSILSAISIAVFLIWELTDKSPIVNLRMFRHRNFTVGTIAYMLGYAAFFSAALLVPLWLQTQLHYTPYWAGLAAAPIGIFTILLSPFVGRISNRLGLRMMTVLAALLMAAVFFMRSGFNIQVDFETVAYVQLLQGIGIAIFFMPLMTMLLSDLRTDEIADGAGLATFMRTLAASFSVSITTYLWNYRAVVHHAHLVEQFTPFNPATRDAIVALGNGDTQTALLTLDAMITRQAYQIAFNEIFLGLGVIMLLQIVALMFARPPFAGQSPGTAK
jgi:DHA2 family multidrug resistance protein